MTDLFHHIAIASLPIAIGLVALALGAWGALAARLDDADTVRLARTYLEPLSTWALVALGVHVLALLGADEAGGLAIALSLLLAAGAVALRVAPEPQQTTEAATVVAPTAPAPPPTGPVAPTDGPLWSDRTAARRRHDPTALWNG